MNSFSRFSCKESRQKPEAGHVLTRLGSFRAILFADLKSEDRV